MRAWIYDSAISRLTAQWYREVLRRLPRGAHLLDVGIGTGTALVKNADLLRERDLHVTGIDIDEDYLQRCRSRIAKRRLEAHVQVVHQPVEEHVGGPYDAVYFSGSFMLLPEPRAVLEHVMGLLRPGGRVFFTQTFQDRRAPLMEKAKPLLQRVTTIDFGHVTYEDDFREVADSAGMEILALETMSKGTTMSYRLVVGAPRAELQAHG